MRLRFWMLDYLTAGLSGWRMHHPTQSPAFVSDQLTRLRQLRQRRALRDSTNSFVIEGIRQFVQGCDAHFDFDTIFISPVLLKQGLAQKLARRLIARGTRKIMLTPEQFRSISTTERASGVIAIVKQRWTPLNEIDPNRGIGWLIIDHIRSPGNLGTILRTAEAVGMSGILFAGDDCDPHDPAVVRASMGGVFHLPLTRTRPRELSYWLAQHHVATLGLSPQAAGLWSKLPPAARYAIVLGEERAGISSPLRRLCDAELRLPMTGRADSLNVSVAAGVMMYELVRQKISRQRFTPRLFRWMILTVEFYFHEVDRNVMVLGADGGLNADTVQPFVQQLESLIDAGVNQIIVDCSKLDYISSYGIGMLMRLHRKLAARGGDVKIAAPKNIVLKALNVMRIGGLLSIYPDVDQARLAFRPKDATRNQAK